MSRLAYLAGLGMVSPIYAAGSLPKVVIATFLEGSGYQEGTPKVRASYFDAWARKIKSSAQGLEVDVLRPFDSVERFLNDLKAGADFQIFPMYGYDFLECRDECMLSPLCVPIWQNGPQVAYNVYVRKDSPFQTLSDLAGKLVTLEVNGCGNLPSMLLSNALRRSGVEVEQFPSEKPVTTALKAVLPVYFGLKSGNTVSADACVVSQAGIDALNKQNPDIGQRLRSIHAAPPMLSHIIAMRQDVVSQKDKYHLESLCYSFEGPVDTLKPQARKFDRFEEVYLDNLTAEFAYYEKTKKEMSEASAEVSEPKQKANKAGQPNLRIANRTNPTPRLAR